MVTLPWSDGSGDNIYLDYDNNEGNTVISITSDINTTGVLRSKTITFKRSNTEIILGTLTVNQRNIPRAFNGNDDIFVDINLEPLLEKEFNIFSSV